ncbi:MAG: flippase-like domain-containing protein [Sandaracinaceae bacterium]|nr:flippase-like domain-containing protein [Sandaracinaceae bacterium]
MKGLEAPESRMTTDDAKQTDRWAWAKRAARLALFAFGLAAIVYVVNDAGPAHVWATLVGAGVFVPLIVLLEGAFMSMDVLSLRSLIGAPARDVPLSVWVRSGLMAYAIMVLFPGGRAAGEVVRATQLAPYTGGAKAAAYGTRLQAATMLGNTIISVPAALACFWAQAQAGTSSALPWLVLGNGLVTAAIGGGILFVSRRSKVGGWIGQKFSALASHGASFDEALRDETPFAPALLFSALGRACQTLQYGIILVAVGGSLGLVSALVSQGIHLVGAGAGDLVPNQAGITEGAYWMFAEALGLSADPAAAVGIALIARFCQYILAGIGLVAGAVWRAPTPASAS